MYWTLNSQCAWSDVCGKKEEAEMLCRSILDTEQSMCLDRCLLNGLVLGMVIFWTDNPKFHTWDPGVLGLLLQRAEDFLSLIGAFHINFETLIKSSTPWLPYGIHLGWPHLDLSDNQEILGVSFTFLTMYCVYSCVFTLFQRIANSWFTCVHNLEE